MYHRQEELSAIQMRSISTSLFIFFDVGSSYSRVLEVTKCRIVHPLTGNVSWV